MKGKPAYLAPEQLEGKPIDGRVDLFALGIVMHEMLSLQHLFAGDSDLHTAKKIMEMKIPGLTAHRPDVPEELERIVMRALERDRRNRFSTAAEMARALDDFVVGSQQHLDEVAAFVREIEAISPLARPASVESAKHVTREPATPEPEEEPTVKDRSLSRRMWRLPAHRAAPGRRDRTLARGAWPGDRGGPTDHHRGRVGASPRFAASGRFA